MAYFPVITARLVDALAQIFPNTAPSGPEVSDREVMFRAGQASVVSYLAQRLEEQENDYAAQLLRQANV